MTIQDKIPVIKYRIAFHTEQYRTRILGYEDRKTEQHTNTETTENQKRRYQCWKIQDRILLLNKTGKDNSADNTGQDTSTDKGDQARIQDRIPVQDNHRIES
jgi:hypothetical protein